MMKFCLPSRARPSLIHVVYFACLLVETIVLGTSTEGAREEGGIIPSMTRLHAPVIFAFCAACLHVLVCGAPDWELWKDLIVSKLVTLTNLIILFVVFLIRIEALNGTDTWEGIRDRIVSSMTSVSFLLGVLVVINAVFWFIAKPCSEVLQEKYLSPVVLLGLCDEPLEMRLASSAQRGRIPGYGRDIGQGHALDLEDEEDTRRMLDEEK